MAGRRGDAGRPAAPTNKREARSFFLLPPDNPQATLGQLDVIDWETHGGPLDGGNRLGGAANEGSSAGLGPGGRLRPGGWQELSSGAPCRSGRRRG